MGAQFGAELAVAEGKGLQNGLIQADMLDARDGQQSLHPPWPMYSVLCAILPTIR